VLFDVEVIFMYPWAVNFRSVNGEPGLGVAGLFSMLSFIGLFIVGFYYILKKGALKWEE
jgi:NADH-quinone oxidoreductase subunit A